MNCSYLELVAGCRISSGLALLRRHDGTSTEVGTQLGPDFLCVGRLQLLQPPKKIVFNNGLW